MNALLLWTNPATVSAYALDIFSALKDDTDAVAQSFERVQSRVDAVAAALVSDLDADAWWTHPALAQLPTAAESDSVLQLPEVEGSCIKRPVALQAAYEACEEMPPLELVRRSLVLLTRTILLSDLLISLCS